MAQKDLQFGIGIPQVFFNGEIDSNLISNFVVRAEALGYHSPVGGRKSIWYRAFRRPNPFTDLCRRLN